MLPQILSKQDHEFQCRNSMKFSRLGDLGLNVTPMFEHPPSLGHVPIPVSQDVRGVALAPSSSAPSQTHSPVRRAIFESLSQDP